MAMLKQHKPAAHVQAEVTIPLHIISCDKTNVWISQLNVVHHMFLFRQLEGVLGAKDAESMVMSLWTKIIELTRSLSTRM
jgi:hypothetical protein